MVVEQLQTKLMAEVKGLLAELRQEQGKDREGFAKELESIKKQAAEDLAAMRTAMAAAEER
ncbi:unnamed protein product, partial [Symbiodinium pilosum]